MNGLDDFQFLRARLALPLYPVQELPPEPDFFASLRNIQTAPVIFPPALSAWVPSSRSTNQATLERETAVEANRPETSFCGNEFLSIGHASPVGSKHKDA